MCSKIYYSAVENFFQCTGKIPTLHCSKFFSVNRIFRIFNDVEGTFVRKYNQKMKNIFLFVCYFAHLIVPL